MFHRRSRMSTEQKCSIISFQMIVDVGKIQFHFSKTDLYRSTSQAHFSDIIEISEVSIQMKIDTYRASLKYLDSFRL